MKFCPHCKINIGGNLEKCPLCQNLLTGEGEADYCPKIEIKTKTRHLVFRFILFGVIAAIIINLALDYLFIEAEHPSWSPLVLAWLLVSGWITEFILRKHYNLLKAMFFSMIAISILCQFTESFMYLAWDKWNIPYLGITSGYIIPILCSANMVANFVLSMIDKHFTEHSLIFMFLNILVGIVTDTGSFAHSVFHSRTFSISAKLIEHAASYNQIHQLIYDTFSEDRLRLLGYAISNKMEVLDEYATAIISLDKEELAHFNYQVGDTEGVVNYPLSMKKIKMAVLVTERQGVIRLSFRSGSISLEYANMAAILKGLVAM